MESSPDYTAMAERLLPPHLSGARGVIHYRSAARSERLKQISASLLSGRPFAGRVIIDREAGFQTDKIRLKDIANDPKNGAAVAYWTDGSVGGNGNKKGVMGGGMVGKSGRYKYRLTEDAGRYTGDSQDSELFAIAMALKYAKQEIQGFAEFRILRIYTDAQNLLMDLKSKDPSQGTIGPLISGEIMALEVLYGHTECLFRLGVAVELIWVKSHMNSTANEEAHGLARKAVREHAEFQSRVYGEGVPERRVMTTKDAPKAFKKLREDWVEEWLFRANEGINLISSLDSSEMLLQHSPYSTPLC